MIFVYITVIMYWDFHWLLINYPGQTIEICTEIFWLDFSDYWNLYWDFRSNFWDYWDLYLDNFVS